MNHLVSHQLSLVVYRQSSLLANLLGLPVRNLQEGLLVNRRVDQAASHQLNQACSHPRNLQMILQVNHLGLPRVNLQ